jgi:Flp pilus assembly protein TadG
MRARRLSHARRRGGAAMLFVFLIVIPLMFAAATLAVDFALQIMAASQVRAVAESVATAGAGERLPDSDLLDRGAADGAMRATYRANMDARVASLAGNMTPTYTVRDREAIVTITYRVPLRPFSGWFLPGNDPSFSVRRSAVVCTPGTERSGTGGYCASPWGG